MGRLWGEEMERRYRRYRGSMEAWEVLHEEAGFEDVGMQSDRMLTDLDGTETHLHIMQAVPR